MKKLLREGSTDFKPAKNKVKTLLFLILLSCEGFSQIPINGFCKYQSFAVDSGFQKFLPLNYNDDFYTDLFFYNPFDDNIVSLDGGQNATFGKKAVKRLQEALTDVQYLWDKNNKIYAYAFISRKQSSAGILKFNLDGIPEVESAIKFNTYPGHLCTGDVNGDGISELLISGSAFNGLSLIYQEDKPREDKISENTSYSEAEFADLNADGSPDIAAFNIFSNNLQFLYNNSKGKFSKVREIPFSYPINSIKTTDLNLDSYPDLMYSLDKTIGILYGDFKSSYEDTVILHTKYNIEKFITGDFNRDGKIDIAYINKTWLL